MKIFCTVDDEGHITQTFVGFATQPAGTHEIAPEIAAAPHRYRWQNGAFILQPESAVEITANDELADAYEAVALLYEEMEKLKAIIGGEQ
ncbi:MAG: hypothetical protein ACOY9Y_09695 [Bacillota bacterium]